MYLTLSVVPSKPVFKIMESIDMDSTVLPDVFSSLKEAEEYVHNPNNKERLLSIQEVIDSEKFVITYTRQKDSISFDHEEAAKSFMKGFQTLVDRATQLGNNIALNTEKMLRTPGNINDAFIKTIVDRIQQDVIRIYE